MKVFLEVLGVGLFLSLVGIISIVYGIIYYNFTLIVFGIIITVFGIMTLSVSRYEPEAFEINYSTWKKGEHEVLT